MPESLSSIGSIFLLAGLGICVAGAGRFILAGIPLVFSSWGEQLFFSAAIGFGVLGYAVFLLALFGLLTPVFLHLLVGIVAVLALAGWTRVTRVAPPADLAIPAREDRIAGILLAGILVLGFVLMLTPEVGKDALIYHLAVPKLFLQHGGFYFIPGNIFAHYPLHSEMLFLLALFLQGDILAKGLHFLALGGILLGIGQFIRFHLAGNRFPAFGMLVFCSIPTVFITAAMAYNDLFVTWYCLAAVFAFTVWAEKPETAWLVVCGLFTGLALAVKYTALLLPCLGCLGVLWASRRHGLRTADALRHLFRYLFAAVIVGSPFYLWNWLVTGNPVYPFLYSLFGGKGWSPDQARLYDLFVRDLGAGRELLDYLSLPWRLSFEARLDSPRFDGILGPIFLLILPFTLAIRRIEPPLKIFLVYSAFMFLFWIFSAQQLRYLMPLFPVLAIVVSAIFSHTRAQGYRKLLAILTILTAVSITSSSYEIVRYFLKIKPIPVVTGGESREVFLQRLLPSYGIFRYANAALPADAKIFLIYMKNRGFLLERAHYSDSMFESYTIQKILRGARSTANVCRELQAGGFTHILYDLNYVYGPASTFSEQERTLFAAFQKEHLALIKRDGPYFLFRIEPSPRPFRPGPLPLVTR